jgi:ribosomal protein L10
MILLLLLLQLLISVKWGKLSVTRLNVERKDLWNVNMKLARKEIARRALKQTKIQTAQAGRHRLLLEQNLVKRMVGRRVMP